MIILVSYLVKIVNYLNLLVISATATFAFGNTELLIVGKWVFPGARNTKFWNTASFYNLISLAYGFNPIQYINLYN